MQRDYLTPGATVDRRYRVERLLGCGDSTVIIEVLEIRLRRRCALKIFTGDVRSDAARRFERAVHTLARLASPHIVSILDTGTAAQGEPFLVMELLEGSDLREVLRERGALSREAVIEVGTQVCHALGSAHAHGITHQELAPSNVFLTAPPDVDPLVRPHVKLLSFSGAALPGVDPPTKMDPREDIRLLGSLLYELVEGRKPLALPPGVQTRGPAHLATVIACCLQADVRYRYQSVREVADALHGVRVN